MPKSLHTIQPGQIMTVTPTGNVQVYRPGAVGGGFLASATIYGPFPVAREIYVDGNANVAFAMAEPTNLRGTFTCNGATPVAVANANVQITDVIIISLNTVGGTVGAIPAVVTITAGVGFNVRGTASDTSVYNYAIIRNAT